MGKLSKADYTKAIEALDSVKTTMDDLSKNDKDSDKGAIIRIAERLMGINSEPLEKMDMEEFYRQVYKPFEGKDLDTLTAVDVAHEELKLWGIARHSKGYKIIVYIMANYQSSEDGKKPDLETVYGDIEKKFDKDRKKINEYLNTIIKRADFSQGIYLPVLKRLKIDDITPELLLNEFLDYV